MPDLKPTSKIEKKPYVKPEIKKVPLRPEESCLGGCKITGQYGPMYSNCNLSGSYCQTSLS